MPQTSTISPEVADSIATILGVPEGGGVEALRKAVRRASRAQLLHINDLIQGSKDAQDTDSAIAAQNAQRSQAAQADTGNLIQFAPEELAPFKDGPTKQALDKTLDAMATGNGPLVSGSDVPRNMVPIDTVKKLSDAGFVPPELGDEADALKDGKTTHVNFVSYGPASFSIIPPGSQFERHLNPPGSRGPIIDPDIVPAPVALRNLINFNNISSKKEKEKAVNLGVYIMPKKALNPVLPLSPPVPMVGADTVIAPYEGPNMQVVTSQQYTKMLAAIFKMIGLAPTTIKQATEDFYSGKPVERLFPEPLFEGTPLETNVPGSPESRQHSKTDYLARAMVNNLMKAIPRMPFEMLASYMDNPVQFGIDMATFPIQQAKVLRTALAGVIGARKIKTFGKALTGDDLTAEAAKKALKEAQDFVKQNKGANAKIASQKFPLGPGFMSVSHVGTVDVEMDYTKEDIDAAQDQIFQAGGLGVIFLAMMGLGAAGAAVKFVKGETPPLTPVEEAKVSEAKATIAEGKPSSLGAKPSGVATIPKLEPAGRLADANGNVVTTKTKPTGGTADNLLRDIESKAAPLDLAKSKIDLGGEATRAQLLDELSQRVASDENGNPTIMRVFPDAESAAAASKGGAETVKLPDGSKIIGTLPDGSSIIGVFTDATKVAEGSLSAELAKKRAELARPKAGEKGASATKKEGEEVAERDTNKPLVKKGAKASIEEPDPPVGGKAQPSGRNATQRARELGESGQGAVTFNPETGLPTYLEQPPLTFLEDLLAAARNVFATVRWERMDKGTLGFFEHGMKADKIAVGNIRNMSTIAHELGHALDFAIHAGMRGTKNLFAKRAKVYKGDLTARFGSTIDGKHFSEKQLVEEAWNVSRDFRPMAGPVSEEHMAYRNRGTELMADFIGEYIIDPQRTRALAPNLTEMLERNLKKAPELEGLVKSLHERDVVPNLPENKAFEKARRKRILEAKATLEKFSKSIEEANKALKETEEAADLAQRAVSANREPEAAAIAKELMSKANEAAAAIKGFGAPDALRLVKTAREHFNNGAHSLSVEYSRAAIRLARDRMAHQVEVAKAEIKGDFLKAGELKRQSKGSIRYLELESHSGKKSVVPLSTKAYRKMVREVFTFTSRAIDVKRFLARKARELAVKRFGLSEEHLNKGDETFAIEGTGNPTIPGDTHAKLVERLTPAGKKLIKWYQANSEILRADLNEFLQKLDGEGMIRFLEDYVSHYTVGNGPKDVSRIAMKLSNKLDALHERRVPTIQEIMEAGGEMRTLDLTKLYQMQNDVGWRFAYTQSLMDALVEMTDGNGMPGVMDAKKAPDWYVMESANPVFDFLSKVTAEDGKVIKPGMRIAMHPEVYKAARALAYKYPFDSSKFWRAVRIVSAFIKTAKLSFSLFHAVAIVENSSAAIEGTPLSGLVVFKWTDPITGKVVKGVNTPARLGKLLMDTNGFVQDMIADGIPAGHPAAEQAINLVTEKLAAAEAVLRNLSGKKMTRGGRILYKALEKGVKTMRVYKEGFDHVLWDKLHAGTKAYAWYEYTSKIARRNPGMSPEDFAAAKRTLAPLFNNAFGGQEWATQFYLSPRVRAFMDITLLAPDWTLSNIKVAASSFQINDRVFRFGADKEIGYKTISFTKDPVARDFQMMYWRRMMIDLFLANQAAQFGIYQAFGDDSLGDKPFTWMNGSRHLTEIDWTPLARQLPPWLTNALSLDEKFIRKGGRYYTGVGKQVGEVMNGMYRPIMTYKGKMSPLFQLAFTMANHTIFNSVPNEHNKTFMDYFTTISFDDKYDVSFVQDAIGAIQPFSLSGGTFFFALPVRKGLTQFGLKEAYRAALLSYTDPDLVRDLWDKGAYEALRQRLNEPDFLLDPHQLFYGKGALMSSITEAGISNGLDVVAAASAAIQERAATATSQYIETINDPNATEEDRGVASLRLIKLGLSMEYIAEKMLEQFPQFQTLLNQDAITQFQVPVVYAPDGLKPELTRALEKLYDRYSPKELTGE